ncbi:hypothetical protein [Emticicia sp. 17c]|uniref:hypothetical protein n=1 Tax=Emticicia sp. 17c TaxID=3127704 RepID=UPI00301D781B
MKKNIFSIMALMLTGMLAFGQQVEIKRFNQDFSLQNIETSGKPTYHVFTNYSQMNSVFKPAIISENNAVPVIGNKDFVNQFVVAISGSTSEKTKPLITTIQPKNNSVYVYYEEVKSSDRDKSAVVAIDKSDFKEVVFVDRNTNKQKVIYYNDVPPTISKIVLSYLDMPLSQEYKHEYQISIDEMGEVIVVQDENGQIVNRTDFMISPEIFEQLKSNTVNLDKAGEKVERYLVKDKNYREILLLDDSNKVVYSLTWDNLNQVNSATQQFVKAIENLVPDSAISFNKHSKTVVAKN